MLIQDRLAVRLAPLIANADGTRARTRCGVAARLLSAKPAVRLARWRLFDRDFGTDFIGQKLQSLRTTPHAVCFHDLVIHDEGAHDLKLSAHAAMVGPAHPLTITGAIALGLTCGAHRLTGLLAIQAHGGLVTIFSHDADRKPADEPLFIGLRVTAGPTMQVPLLQHCHKTLRSHSSLRRVGN